MQSLGLYSAGTLSYVYSCFSSPFPALPSAFLFLPSFLPFPFFPFSLLLSLLSPTEAAWCHVLWLKGLSATQYSTAGEDLIEKGSEP